MHILDWNTHRQQLVAGADAGSTSKRSSMFRNAVVLAIVLVLGSSGLAASAFAHSGGGRRDGFRGNHFTGGFDGTPGDGHSGYGSRVSGLRGYDGRDMWGHRGNYYGPMIPTI